MVWAFAMETLTALLMETSWWSKSTIKG